LATLQSARDILGAGEVADHDLGADRSQRIGAIIFPPDERANRQAAPEKHLHNHATNPADAASGACDKNRTVNRHKYNSNLCVSSVLTLRAPGASSGAMDVQEKFAGCFQVILQ
jgi:hypothetical protein